MKNGTDSITQVTIERSYRASIDDVWELWTTKDGIESWWGPDGFATEVVELDLVPDGAFVYDMTATAFEQVAFMKSAGLPLTSRVRSRYKEVVAKRRLSYTTVNDFIPGVEPYEVTTQIDLETNKTEVRMTIRFDVMHTEDWTRRALMGWESQLRRFATVVAEMK